MLGSRLPWYLLVVVALIAGAVTGGYRWGHGAAVDQQLADAARDQVLFDKVQEGVAQAIAHMTIKNVTVRQEVQREVVEKPVYRDCRHDTRVMQLINAALTGEVPAGVGAVSGSGAIDRPELRGDDNKTRGSGGPVSAVPESGAGVRNAGGGR